MKNPVDAVLLLILRQQGGEPKREQALVAEAVRIGYAPSAVAAALRRLVSSGQARRVNPQDAEFGIYAPAVEPERHHQIMHGGRWY